MNLAIIPLKWSLRIVGAIVFILILMVPSIYDRSLIDSTIFPKTLFLIQCLLIVAVVFFIILVAVKIPAKSFRISKIDLTLLVLFIYVILNRDLIHSGFNFSIRHVEFMGLGFFYLTLRLLPIKYYPWFLLSIALSGAIQSVHGIIQLLGYAATFSSRFVITGSFLNPGPYAGFLAVSWSITLGIYLFKDSLINKLPNSIKEHSSLFIQKAVCAIFEYVPAMALLAMLVALPATKSRAALLAVFLSSIILFVFKYKLLQKINQWSIVRKTAILFSCCVVLGVGLLGVYQVKKNSADGRLLIWKITSNIVADNPVWGVGQDRFSAHYMEVQADYFSKSSNSDEVQIADTTWFAFNDVLQFLVENGVIGLFVVVILSVWCITLKVSSSNLFVKKIIIGVFSTFLFFALFSYPSHILPIKVVLVFCLVFLAIIDDAKIQLRFPNHYSMLGGRFTTAIVSLILIWTSFQFYQSSYSGFRDFKSTMDSFYFSETNNESSEVLEALLPIQVKDPMCLRLYGQLLTVNSQHEKAIEVLEIVRKHKNSARIEVYLGDNYKVLKQYENAEAAYQKAANMIPNRFYPHYLLAMLYEESGQQEKAQVKAKELLAKEIKVPSKAIEEMKMEMRRILMQKEPLTMGHDKYQITL